MMRKRISGRQFLAVWLLMMAIIHIIALLFSSRQREAGGNV